MTEQTPKPTTEMITVPDWSEKQVAKPELLPYEEAAAEIAALDDPVEQRDEVESFIEGVFAEAEAGLLKTVRKNEADGSVQITSYNKAALLSQLQAFELKANAPDGSDIMLLIPSAKNLRSAFNTLASNEHASYALMDGLSTVLRKQEALVRSEKSPEHNETVRQKASEDLGQEAVEQVAELSIDAQIEALTNDLSEDDRNELISYANNHEMMVEARTEGNGKEAQLREQYKGQSLRAMSPAAQAVANSFVTLFLKRS